MTSRQIPNFLKRAAKRDVHPSSSSTSSSASTSSASRSIRFSSLGADDYDLFDHPSASSPSHPLELIDDKEEEAAQEALLTNFVAPPDSPPGAAASELSEGGAEASGMCPPARQVSISAPPDLQLQLRDDELSLLGLEGDAAAASVTAAVEEPEEPLERSGESAASSGGRKAAVDLLDDIDKTFDSVPKPAGKPRKPPSAYAKPRQKPSVTKVAPPVPPLLPEGPPELDDEADQAGPPEKPPGESIFDREEPAFEAEIAAAMEEAPKLAEERVCASVPASPPRSLPSPAEPSNRSSASSTPLASTPPPLPDPLAPPPAVRRSSDLDLMAVLLDKRFAAAAALIASAVALRILPSASFFIGFFWGGVVVLGVSYLYRLLQTRSQPRDTLQTVTELRELPPPNIPHIADEPDDGGGIFRGWLNELNVYVPDSYHINQTSSVFVSLDATQLRIQRPKQSVQKRAMWNEVLPGGAGGGCITFIHQRHFEMMGAKVTLEPAGLVKKRVWSKKYPICIVVPVANIVGTTPTARGSKGGGGGGGGRRQLAPQAASGHGGGADDFEWVEEQEVSCERLYLFARTCREKEEWFRRFEAAAKGKPLQLSLKRIVNTHLEDDRSSSFFAASNITGGSVGDGLASSSTGAVSFSALSGSSNNGGSGGSGSPTGGGSVGGESAGGLPGPAEPWSDRLPGNDRESLAVTYTRYMARFMPADWLMKAAKSHRLSINYISCDPQVLWLNAILGRGVWDFLREKIWADTVKQKIQNKLRKIHLPYFIDELSVVEISLGKDFPVIRRAGKPFLDRRGLWVELEIAYCGGSSMALETKVNLMKLRRPKHEAAAEARAAAEASAAAASAATAATAATSSSGGGGGGLGAARATPGESGGGPPTAPRRGHGHSRTGAFCSEEEDSAESTTDSELDENPEADIVTDPDKGNHVGGGTSRKLLRFVDRISRSSYFHKAIENKFIQRGMEYVSNTRIVLHVEVRGLSGTLMINVPPPPTDRLWYGFKPCPKLILAARPKVGAKELTMSRLTEWIEKKLELEFQRIFVLPNMDDLVVPLLLSGNPECSHHSDSTPFAKS